jgi:VanZ family protein
VSARRPGPALRVLAPLALMATIFYFSSQPFDGHALDWWELALRKLGHVTGYALLTAAWWWALVGVVRRPLAAAAAISVLYACTDEYHQSFVAGRHGTPVDVGVDAIGMAIACFTIQLRHPRTPAKRKLGQDSGGPAKRAHFNRA